MAEVVEETRLERQIGDADRHFREQQRRLAQGLTMKGGGASAEASYADAYQRLVSLDSKRFPQLRKKYRR